MYMLSCKQDTFCEMLFNTKQKRNFEKPGKAGIWGFIVVPVVSTKVSKLE